MKVGDLVQSADRVPARRRLGLIMEVDPDEYDSQGVFNTCFIQWVGDSDWTFLYEDDFEVISERG